jgi:hypothetical protein
MSARLYSLLTLLWILLGLGSIALFNYFVDPFGQYDSGCFRPIVQDSRAEKLELIETIDEAPNGLILGSSRVLKIEPAYLESVTNLKFFNVGVNHGRPSDYVAWTRWYEQRWGKYPDVVIIGVDTAAFHEVIPIDGRITGEPKLASLVPELVSIKEHCQLMTELVGFKQTKASLLAWLNHARGRNDRTKVEFFDRDGRIVYQQREKELESGTYDFANALEYNRGEFKSVYGSFRHLSTREMTILASLVRTFRDHNVQVYLFNTPFHPELRKSLEALPQFEEREREAKLFLEILSERTGSIAMDLSRIESFDGDASMFVDGIHPLELNTRKMIDRLLETPGANKYALQ